jgi:hypothetical protein
MREHTSGLVPKNERNRTDLRSFATIVERHIMVEPKLKNEVANSMIILWVWSGAERVWFLAPPGCNDFVQKPSQNEFFCFELFSNLFELLFELFRTFFYPFFSNLFQELRRSFSFGKRWIFFENCLKFQTFKLFWEKSNFPGVPCWEAGHFEEERPARSLRQIMTTLGDSETLLCRTCYL